MFRTSIVFSFVFAMLLVAPAHAQEPADALLHKPAPSFVRKDLKSRHIDLSAYKGKVVLLNFWATWCAPCQIEMPRFAAWQKEYGAQGFQVIAVSMDDEQSLVLDFLKKHPMPFPVLMGDEELGSLYGGVLGLPVTFMIDRNGTITATFKGETRPDLIQAEIRKLLAAH